MSKLFNELLEEGLDRRNEKQAAKSTNALLELASKAEEFKWGMPTDNTERREQAFGSAWNDTHGKEPKTS